MHSTLASWHALVLQVLLDDLQEAVRGFTRSLTAAVAFVDSRHAGMLALLDRQAKEVLKKVQVNVWHCRVPRDGVHGVHVCVTVRVSGHH